MFADFLFIDGEDVAILAACGAGEGHGFEEGGVEGEEEFRCGTSEAAVMFDPSVRAEWGLLADHRGDDCPGRVGVRGPVLGDDGDGFFKNSAVDGGHDFLEHHRERSCIEGMPTAREGAWLVEAPGQIIRRDDFRACRNFPRERVGQREVAGKESDTGVWWIGTSFKWGVADDD